MRVLTVGIADASTAAAAAPSAAVVVASDKDTNQLTTATSRKTEVVEKLARQTKMF